MRAQLVPVLVRPMYPGNVGAVMRAAGNFGAGQLLVVQPACNLEDVELVKMAMGAEQRITMKVETSLTSALAPFPVALGFTSLRERDPRGVYSVWDVPPLLAELSVPAALVFGPERGGLSRQELALCSHLVTIPTDPEFPVMNLAQAAAVALAVLTQGSFTKPQPRLAEDLPAPRCQVEQALAHLEQVLLESKFLDPHNPRRVFDQIRRVVGRGLPTGREVKILHALAAHIAYLWRRASHHPRPASLTSEEHGGTDSSPLP
ncbi:MAG: TrmH family RNA methyltransferase [Thermoanaerobaculum sp.]|nr:TrmH family RNA methyltransferase [Thermoanaerobaculum sp.]